MSKAEKELPELVRVADALEHELAKLEALSRSVRKIRLNSEKTIARAATELKQTLELQDGLAQGLAALAGAMSRMQARQGAALEPLAAFATEIQERMQKLEQHMQAFAALGARASEVTALLQSNDGERNAIIDRVDESLAELCERARVQSEAARIDDFPDVAREADALKQRVAALRRRLGAKTFVN